MIVAVTPGPGVPNSGSTSTTFASSSSRPPSTRVMISAPPAPITARAAMSCAGSPATVAASANERTTLLARA